ncbi:hypothetical protein CONCODRAFT_18467 [Conidiobolus coronatus NRRL 28638]|uniref:F-box domain-containing protein n=1 Tax=Conidiobolus coronatus (strain ATCC 28846 / CBS 209.66 / NRRL 28638) TaxID=796925 RepID=A0A137P2F7_CONC2|nr:hypothetical protein CONCODRAFT_18467 [Conidiobolus coronatus NRRL 28638]|eukprot:KXN69213.1 hypothetical protein CONCODRAFT_18467 [Conidiobolus coronatus NRRL 28638]
MLLIPNSATNGLRANYIGYAVISKEDEEYLEYLTEKYHKFTHELSISYFNSRAWEISSQKFINIQSLILSSLSAKQENLVTLICSFPALKKLKIETLSTVRWDNDTVVQDANLPESLVSFEIFNSNMIFCRGYRAAELLNTHSNLKYLRIEHEKLLERLLDPYPSLEHLIVRLSDQTRLLQPSFRNLINLRTLDLLYPKLSYNMIESILMLPNLEDFKFNSRIEPFSNSMKIILCTNLKQLSIRSIVFPEWTEFFINSCPNIESLKLVYSKNSLIFTKPQMFNQLKHLIIIYYSSEKFDLQALLLSPILKRLELFVSRSVEDFTSEFFEDLNSISNWKNIVIDNRIVLYK